MALKKKLGIILLLFFAGINSTYAQARILKGVVMDKQSDEPIPFASVVFKVSGRGVLTDSVGRFEFQLNTLPVGDTLQVLNVGYKITAIPFASIKDSSFITAFIFGCISSLIDITESTCTSESPTESLSRCFIISFI